MINYDIKDLYKNYWKAKGKDVLIRDLDVEFFKKYSPMKKQIIGLDFDGTCVTHEFPKIGKDIGAVPVLKDLVNAGHKLILFTMRSGEYLDDAVRWFGKNEIPLYGIQTNPTQSKWTLSPKAYCTIYIDDAALGCPTILDTKKCVKPYVDWKQVRLAFNAGFDLLPQADLPAAADIPKQRWVENGALTYREVFDYVTDLLENEKRVRPVMNTYCNSVEHAIRDKDDFAVCNDMECKSCNLFRRALEEYQNQNSVQ